MVHLSAVVLVCHDHNPRVGNCRAAAETLDEFHLRGVIADLARSGFLAV